VPDVIERRLADLGEFIRQQREVTRMSVRRLADVTGVSNPYLSQIERGLRRPSAEILQQLARGLRISAETLYVRAGILDPDSMITMSVPDAINRDERLTPDQKSSMLTIYQSFVSQLVEPVPTSAAEKPGANKPAAAEKAGATKPGATKPGATKPGATKPAGANKQAVAKKLAAATKPAASKRATPSPVSADGSASG